MTSSRTLKPSLDITVCFSSSNLTFSHPYLLASGILGATCVMLERIARSGIGGVITKSIGLEPRDGYTNPTVIGLGRDRVLNAIGLSNPGAKYAQNELKNYTVTDVPLIASVFGASGDEIANVIQIIDQPIISAFELNLSCPHGGLYGAAIGTDCAVVEDVVNTTKSVTSKPIWAKLTPNVTDIVNIAKDVCPDGVKIIEML